MRAAPNDRFNEGTRRKGRGAWQRGLTGGRVGSWEDKEGWTVRTRSSRGTTALPVQRSSRQSKNPSAFCFLTSLPLTPCDPPTPAQME